MCLGLSDLGNEILFIKGSRQVLDNATISETRAASTELRQEEKGNDDGSIHRM